MDNARLLECLATDFGRLRTVASATDDTAPVPSCPGWSVTDLVQHVADVYRDKALTMQTCHEQEWPLPTTGLAPLDDLTASYAMLTEQFATRDPAQITAGWFAPDQSVGFWIRRMAQETVIHRVDAELAAATAVTPIPADLAADGIDEVLNAFLVYEAGAWPDYFRGQLQAAPPATVAIRAADDAWLVSWSPEGISLGGSTPDASIDGPASALLRSLWGRGGDGEIQVSGSGSARQTLRTLLATATQ